LFWNSEVSFQNSRMTISVHGLNADPRTDLGGGVKMAALGAAAGAAIAVGFARRRVAIGSRLTTR